MALAKQRRIKTTLMDRPFTSHSPFSTPMTSKLVSLPVWFENHVRALFDVSDSDVDFEALFDATFAKDTTFVQNGTNASRDDVKQALGGQRGFSSNITVTFGEIIEAPLKDGDEVVSGAGVVAGKLRVTRFSKFLVHDVRQKTETSVFFITTIRPDPTLPSDQGQDNRRVVNNNEVVTNAPNN
ncbi:hypothetical protein HGRIS_014377 [Hohenbuehelia grisea]|uniref:SnoaL-like domain-containing protein n=1 Tax=Hohenbuehelia grisea TaxID=104357 RepID=A0ABR3JUZ5_9AGAR